MNYWLLAFRGFTRMGLSDGAVAIIAAHLPQLRGVTLP